MLPRPESYGTFCERVRILSTLHGLSVTSGGRTEGRNDAVNGHRRSKHLWSQGGWAFDLATDTLSHSDEVKIKNVIQDGHTLGLTIKWHDAGTGSHFHVQGLRVGETI